MKRKRTRRGFLAALGSVALAAPAASATADEGVEIAKFEFESGRIDVTDDETATVSVTYRNPADSDRTIFPSFTPFRRRPTSRAKSISNRSRGGTAT
ncbi:hypothetical protein [Halorussus caseinilyticus]|uniref:Uncharacterized protein n=1 Tax=Halorussus caseinilyticus TaxID=3034025 RepID=A0ABD5WHP4_9EURY